MNLQDNNSDFDSDRDARMKPSYDEMLEKMVEEHKGKEYSSTESMPSDDNDDSNNPEGRNNDDSSNNKNQESAATIALKMISGDWKYEARDHIRELFKDQFNTPYLAVCINNHIETMPIKSNGKFKMWVCKTYYENQGQPISSETVSAICNIMQGKAFFGDNVKHLDLRISDGGVDLTNNEGLSNRWPIYYDLGDTGRHVVKITENRWSIEDSMDVPIMFRRYSNQLAQVIPSPDYPPDIFDQFMSLININDESTKLILKCYIISLFIPGIPKPVLMLHGEQGSAKSTCQELTKKIVDPSSILTLTFPRNINELVQQLSHNYVAYYENLSNIPDWISDQLCRAVTGSGFSKRELYSDDDDVVYQFIRCVGFNGVNLVAEKPDLLDRGIIIQLEFIPKKLRRKLKEDILPKFEMIRPQLLGYIFDILAKVLRVKSSGGIKLETRSRMADFEEYAEIISRCMGNADYEFIRAYHENKKLQTDAALEARPIATVIIKFMESQENWSGTATQLLEALESMATELKIDTHRNSLWPKSPGALSRRLNEVKNNLRDVSILVGYSKDSKTRLKIIEIRKISSESFESSESSELHSFEGEFPNDITMPANEISSSQDKMSSDKINKNHAQDPESNDMNDMNDILNNLHIPRNQQDNKEKSDREKLRKNDTEQVITARPNKGNISRTHSHSDKFQCSDCKVTGDRFAMEEHLCSGSQK